MQVLTSHRKHKMTLDQHGNSYCVACHTGKQGVHPANLSQVADEKSITENNDNNNNIDITPSAPTLNKHQKARKERNSKERKECPGKVRRLSKKRKKKKTSQNGKNKKLRTNCNQHQ